MHRRWMSVPLLTSCVSAFYPYKFHEAKDDSTIKSRFASVESATDGSQDGMVTMDIRKMPKRDNTFPVVISNQVSAPNAMPISQDGSDFSYFSTMQFGSKKQNMYMLIDTGSANTWVMGQDCSSKSCTIHHTFGKDDSTTLKTSPNTKWSLAYGTGSVSGYTATDTVSFANFTFNLGFGIATTASDDFNNYPMDGILGLGRATSDELGTPTVMEVLGTQGKLAANTLAIHLNRASDNLKDGEITFGGIDTSKFSGSISYTKTSNNAAWEIPVDDALVNGTPCKFTKKSAIVDTGTSYVLMPPSDAQILHGLIPGSGQNGEAFTVPCDSSANVQVSFSGVKYSISPKDYIGKNTGSGNICASNIVGHQAFGPDEWILGDVFLKNVYVVFDFDQGRVGFGMPGSGGNAASFSPTPTSSNSSPSSLSSGASAGSSSFTSVSPQQSSTLMTTLSSARTSSTGSSTASSSSVKASTTTEQMGNPFDTNSTPTSSSSNTNKSDATSLILSSSSLNLLWTMMLAFTIGLVI